jgi:hypothetical protein
VKYISICGIFGDSVARLDVRLVRVLRNKESLASWLCVVYSGHERAMPQRVARERDEA